MRPKLWRTLRFPGALLEILVPRSHPIPLNQKLCGGDLDSCIFRSFQVSLMHRPR